MSNVRKKFGLYIGGRDKVGEVQEYTPPVLEVMTEDFRAGGMDMAIAMDMGMSPMSATWTMAEDKDVLSLFGLTQGRPVAVFVRSALHDDETGTVVPALEELRGKLTKVDHGTKTSGSYTPTSFEMKLSYYRYEQAGAVIHEIDPKNMVRIINGVDQLAEFRSALGK
ncbi:phage major tail tube protein [Photobacterium leiognathi]|uniref:phage major tail tube protein n=1 Tax=Photobacterium leiognathi TaxID=553611 RepID=UPI00020880D5|nr:phage major tail tube protein [Photobacterium leiognathi]PSW48328.1 phage major tail tube protein [Photobacterium leiognathi subsp. mandapamensis]GAA03237.1 phage major tail tube protein [Photobacterium leiognathi subsp. mandapamensis svers.1.1.]